MRNNLVTSDARSNLLRAFKATGCVECRRRYPALDWSELHIDHIDASDKPAHGAANRLSRMSVADKLSELLTCQVLCVECHYAKHSNGSAPVVAGQLEIFVGNGSWHYD